MYFLDIKILCGPIVIMVLTAFLDICYFLQTQYKLQIMWRFLQKMQIFSLHHKKLLYVFVIFHLNFYVYKLSFTCVP